MDIVERLRTKSPSYVLIGDAAVEIERLREALVEIVYQIGQGNNMAAMDIAAPIAEAALQQKESE